MKCFVRCLTMLVLSGATLRAGAVTFNGSQTGLDEWTYDLTYEPLDNYSVCQPFTTITLTGVSGVTDAFAPTSTDFDPPGGFLDVINLAWTPEVFAGGTAVRWTHDGPGTGNFSVDKHVFGFTVIAAGAVDGIVTVETDGFEVDTICDDRDIIDNIAGPVAGSDDCTGFPSGRRGDKFLLCHVPPGNPAKAHAISISEEAVAAHLRNHDGDHCGPCE